MVFVTPTKEMLGIISGFFERSLKTAGDVVAGEKRNMHRSIKRMIQKPTWKGLRFMYGFNLTNSWAMQLIAFRQMENIGEPMQFAYRFGRALKMPPYVFTPSSSGLNTKGSLSISVF